MFCSRSASLALVGLFLWVTGCSTHTQIGLGEVADHGKVRVTLTDGERETIHDPWVEGDSIKYLAMKDGYLRQGSVPVDQVVELEAVGTDEVGTVFAVLGVTVLMLGVLYVIACTQSTKGCRVN